MKFLKFNMRERLCKTLIPKDSKIVKKDAITIDEYLNEYVQRLEQLPGVFTKEMLENLLKDFPKSECPNIIESDGELRFTDGDKHMVTLKVPLLTIVPILYISKESVDLDKYYKENFGGIKPQPKSMEDIKGVQVKVPMLNIVPIPAIPIKEDKKKENK